MRRAVSALGAGLLAVALAGCGLLTDPYENRPSGGGEASDRALARLAGLPGGTSAGRSASSAGSRRVTARSIPASR